MIITRRILIINESRPLARVSGVDKDSSFVVSYPALCKAEIAERGKGRVDIGRADMVEWADRELEVRRRMQTPQPRARCLCSCIQVHNH
jgi:hypothetical protein